MGWEGWLPKARPVAWGFVVVASHRNVPLGLLDFGHSQPLCTEPLQTSRYSMPAGTREVFLSCI